MALMDEFREEREALKHGTPKQKLEYFWDYYKWHTIGGLIVLVLLIALLIDFLSQKNEVLYAVMLNSTLLTQEGDFSDQFLAYTGIDSRKNKAVFDDTLRVSFDYITEESMFASQRLANTIAAGQLDVIVADDDIFVRYAMDGILSDLRTVLSPEQLAACEPYFYYVDRSLVEQAIEATQNLDYTFDPTAVPDPSKPELMEEPVLVGVYVESSALLAENYYVSEGDRIVVGLLPNSKHTDVSAKFIEFLLGAE